MKILTLNTINGAGGATKACFRLHTALINEGVESDVLMLERPQGVSRGHNFYDFYVKELVEKRKKKSLLEKIYTKILYELGKDEEALDNKRADIERKLLEQQTYGIETPTFALSRYRIHEHPLYSSAQVIHMHCLNAGYLDYPSFFRENKKPTLWTLHDMNPFTGACIYANKCDGFMKDCPNCPQLQGTDDPNYSQKMFHIKQKALQNVENLTIVCPSRWMLEESKKSVLFRNFRHEYIPYGINSEVFQPREKLYSRQILGIPLDKPVIMFVSYNIHTPRKGYHYLSEALKKLQLQDKVTLCAVGARSTDSTDNGFIEMGGFSDERLMSIVYSAADIFIIPSVEDNLPNTVLESLLCGTPVIGFPIGGIPDMIESGVNGYLCNNVSVDGMAKQINIFMDNPEIFNRQQIRDEAVKKYDSSVQSRAYIKLYNELLQNN